LITGHCLRGLAVNIRCRSLTTCGIALHMDTSTRGPQKTAIFGIYSQEKHEQHSRWIIQGLRSSFAAPRDANATLQRRGSPTYLV
jgi:hypothetical protein